MSAPLTRTADSAAYTMTEAISQRDVRPFHNPYRENAAGHLAEVPSDPDWLREPTEEAQRRQEVKKITAPRDVFEVNDPSRKDVSGAEEDAEDAA